MQNPASRPEAGLLFFVRPVGPRYASAGAMPRRTIRGRSIVVTVASVLREASRFSGPASGAATPSLFLRSSIDHARLILSLLSSASGAHSGSRDCSFIPTPYARPTREECATSLTQLRTPRRSTKNLRDVMTMSKGLQRKGDLELSARVC
jgi:hypothetical protein